MDQERQELEKSSSSPFCFSKSNPGVDNLAEGFLDTKLRVIRFGNQSKSERVKEKYSSSSIQEEVINQKGTYSGSNFFYYYNQLEDLKSAVSSFRNLKFKKR